MNKYSNVLISPIKQVLPNIIAQDIVNVQPMSQANSRLFRMTNDKAFNIVGKWKHKNGHMYYNVEMNKEVREWMAATYAEDKTAWWVHNRYCKVREDILPWLKLKFS